MSVDRGAQRAINDLVDIPVYMGVGQVTAVESHPQWGYLVTLEMRPGGLAVQARMATPGAGSARGDYWPIAVDDEVVVLFPDGDPNRAIVAGFLPSSAAAPPTSWGNSAPLLVHPSGKTFLTSQAAASHAVVLETLLPDLLTSLTEIAAGLASLGIPTTNTSQLVTQLATMYRSAGIKSD